MFRIGVIAILCGLIGSAPSFGATYEIAPPSSNPIDETEVEYNDGYDFGDLTHRLRIFLNGMPWFKPQREIDRLVGNPWQIDERTLEKVNSLPIRARLELFSAMLSAVDQIQMIQSERDVFGPAPGGHSTVLSFEEDEDYEVELDRRVRRVLLDPITEEEWADIGIFLLSKSPFFPKKERDWENLKDEIINYALWPALAILVYQAAAGQMNVSTSGWFLRNGANTWRLGWFVKGKANWHEPEVEGGIRSRTPHIELDVGYKRRFSDEADRAFDYFLLDARTFFLRSFGEVYGWNGLGSFRVEVPSQQLFGQEDFDPRVWASVYAHKQDVFGNRAHQYTTEFRVDRHLSSWAWVNSLGFDGKQVVLQVLRQKKRGEERKTEISGMIVGYLGSEKKFIAQQMSSLVIHLRQDHHDLLELCHRLETETDASSFFFMPSVWSEPSQTRQELRQKGSWLEWTRGRLERDMDEYIELLPKFLATHGRTVENTEDVHQLTGLGLNQFLNMLMALAETSSL